MNAGNHKECINCIFMEYDFDKLPHCVIDEDPYWYPPDFCPDHEIKQCNCDEHCNTDTRTLCVCPCPCHSE